MVLKWNKAAPIRKRRRLLIRTSTGGNIKEKYLSIAVGMQGKMNASRDSRERMEARRDRDWALSWMRKLT